MKETFRRTRIRRSQTMHGATSHGLVALLPPLPNQEGKELMAAMNSIWDELPNRGVCGMIDFVNNLKKHDSSSSGIGKRFLAEQHLTSLVHT